MLAHQHRRVSSGLFILSALLSAFSLFLSLPFFSFHLGLKKELGDKRKEGSLKEVEQC